MVRGAVARILVVPRFAMTIRKKIFLLAGILLALFGVVVGVLATIQKIDSDQIGNIVDYQLPLSRLVAEIDVDTDRYELRMRALRLDPLTPADLKAAVAARQALPTSCAGHPRKPPGCSTRRSRTRTTRPRTASTWRGSRARSSISAARSRLSLPSATARWRRSPTAGARRRGPPRSALPGSTRPSARTSPRSAATSPISTTGHPHDPRQPAARHLAQLRPVPGRLRRRPRHQRRRLDPRGRRPAPARRRHPRIESGTVSEPLSIRTRDEVGELALAFNRMVEELRTRERIKETFGKFVDPRLVSRLIGSGADQAERRTLTMFFSDIKGFSGISEQLTASAIVNLLNSYFGAVAEVIHAHHGVIDKYIGDAVMAFWTPPFSPGDDHAADACLAALAQQDAIVALRTRLPEITGMRRNPPSLEIRMGVATGEAVVGTIGSEAARSYTVIGDSVNLASRLESVNKVYGTSIILSEETCRLAQEVIEARELDLITVAGKTEPVRIYEAMGRAGELGPERIELRQLFDDGLAAYRRRDWAERRAPLRSLPRPRPGGRAGPPLPRTHRRAAQRRRRPIGMGSGACRRNEDRRVTRKLIGLRPLIRPPGRPKFLTSLPARSHRFSPSPGRYRD